MKKIIALVFAGSLALAGCNSVNTTTPTGTTPATNVTVSDVQSLVQTACGFLPAATTIASIIAANNPAVATGSQIAQVVCDAVTKKKALRGAAPTVTVNGQVIEVKGRFVR